MTGNPYIDALAYAGYSVWGLLLFGFPAWMLFDLLRPAGAQHAAPSQHQEEGEQ